MVAGPCGYSDPTPAPLGGVDPYPQPTSRPTVPVTPPTATITPTTEDTDTVDESQHALAKTNRAEPAEDTDTPSLPEDTRATGQMATSTEAEADPLVADTSPRDVSGLTLFRQAPTGAGYDFDEPPSTVEELIERGMFGAGASPTHIALRGTSQADSIRCEWRGVARTPQQREGAIRFWLNLGHGAALPSPEELESRFTGYIDQMAPHFQDAMRASFIPIARGGLTTDYQFLICYVDYNVGEYLLGAGPTKLTVAYDNMSGEAVFSTTSTRRPTGRARTRARLL